MKKILALVMVLCSVFILASCGGKKTDAESKSPDKIDVNNEEVTININGTMSKLDDATFKTYLSVFPQKALGLKEDLYSYKFVFKNSEEMGKKGIKAEAYIENPKNVQGVFFVAEGKFYVYDEAKKEYFLLSQKGRESLKENQSETKNEPEVSFANQEQIVKENDKKLKEMFSYASQEKLGIEKPLNEYSLFVNGATAQCDGETIFVIEVKEKDGTPTECRLAFNEKNQYVFNKKANKFEVLK